MKVHSEIGKDITVRNSILYSEIIRTLTPIEFTGIVKKVRKHKLHILFDMIHIILLFAHKKYIWV